MTRIVYSSLLLVVWASLITNCGPASRPSVTEVGSKRVERTMLDDIADQMQIREATERQKKADVLVSKLEFYEAYKVFDAGGKPFENDRNLLNRKYKSLIDAQRAVAEHKDSAGAHFQLGKAYCDFAADPRGASHREVSLERAGKHLETSIKLDENQEQVYLLLAWVMEQQGKSEQFHPYFAKLEKLQNKSDRALLFLGAESLRQEKYDLAMDYLTRIPETSPQRFEAAYLQGVYYARKGRWLEALFYLSRARNLNPEAKKNFEEALEKRWGHFSDLQGQGMDAYGLGRYSEAAKYLQAHVLYHPEDMEAHYHLAWALFNSGEKIWAVEQFLEVTRVGAQMQGMNPLVIDSITEALNVQNELGLDPVPVKNTIVDYFTKQLALIDRAFSQAILSDQEIQTLAEDEVLFLTGLRKFNQRIQTLRSLERSRRETVNKANSMLNQAALAHQEWDARIRLLEERFQRTLSRLKERRGM